MRSNFALHFTSCLSIALSKILPYWKTIKNTKKLSVFGENDSRRLSNYLQTHNFWKFDHIFRTCNETNYRNIWFAKVTIILIMMVQVLFFNIFSVKYPHLNAVEFSFTQLYIPSYSKTLSQNETKISLLWSEINAKKWVFIVPHHISWQRIAIRSVVTVDYGYFSCHHIEELVFRGKTFMSTN